VRLICQINAVSSAGTVKVIQEILAQVAIGSFAVSITVGFHGAGSGGQLAMAQEWGSDGCVQLDIAAPSGRCLDGGSAAFACGLAMTRQRVRCLWRRFQVALG